MSNFTYYNLKLRLVTPMLATCSEASIFAQHKHEKTKKEVAKINFNKKKLTKIEDQYVGANLSLTAEKELEELKGIIRSYQALVGRKNELPTSVEELMIYAKELETDYSKLEDSQKATVFMKDETGWPMISSHMILGNLKENCRILMAGGEKIFDYKNMAGQIFAAYVKPLELFIKASKDIIKDEKGNRILDERPINFPDNFGKTVTAISLSEVLPESTEFETILRVINGGPITEDLLNRLLDMGKSNGLGAWRGSGNRGAYIFQLKELPNYKEKLLEGWN